MGPVWLERGGFRLQIWSNTGGPPSGELRPGERDALESGPQRHDRLLRPQCPLQLTAAKSQLPHFFLGCSQPDPRQRGTRPDRTSDRWQCGYANMNSSRQNSVSSHKAAHLNTRVRRELHRHLPGPSHDARWWKSLAAQRDQQPEPIVDLDKIVPAQETMRRRTNRHHRKMARVVLHPASSSNAVNRSSTAGPLICHRQTSLAR